jgi:hypothetical protein
MRDWALESAAMGAAPEHAEEPGLRAEHDALASRLSARASVDEVRNGARAAFGLVITGGMAAKLAYDRWGPTHPRAFRGPPALFYAALAAACACAAIAAVAFVRARRHMRLEDADLARLRELRALLGIDR